MNKVSFIGIGVQKAATTWLYHVLSDHPEVTVSGEKELNYFTASYDRGALWYEANFAPEANGTQMGECSPTYFFSADAPERAKDYNPDLKLIAILRDPVARCFSNHLHEVRKAHIPDDTAFETALKRNPAYIAQSRYKTNLTRWINAFGRENLLVLLSEDIAKDPETAYRNVCAYLGISDTYISENLRDRQNESVTYRFGAVQKTLRKLGDGLRGLGLGKAVKSIKALPGLRSLLAMNKQHLTGQVAEMKAETRAELEQLFSADIAFVADLLQRPDLPWPSQTKAVKETQPVKELIE